MHCRKALTSKPPLRGFSEHFLCLGEKCCRSEIWDSERNPYFGDSRAAELFNKAQAKSSLQTSLSYVGLGWPALQNLKYYEYSYCILFPFHCRGSIKILTFRSPTLWRGHRIHPLLLQQRLGWICGCHLQPAPTALRSLGLGKARSLLARAGNTPKWEQHPMGAASSHDISFVWHHCSCNHCRDQPCPKKEGGDKAALPKGQLPLSLQFRKKTSSK